LFDATSRSVILELKNVHTKVLSAHPFLEYSQTVCDPHTSGAVAKIESVQKRPAWYTLNRYHRTSSVNAMIAELNWQTLADRCRVARLLMFYKIHYHLIAIDMSQSPKLDLNLPVPRTFWHIPYHRQTVTIIAAYFPQEQ